MTLDVRREVKFTKLIGGWGFKWGFLEFFAYHNEAGFAGRDWELQIKVADHSSTNRYHPGWRFVLVEDMLASRRECVDVAVAKYEVLKHQYGRSL